MAFHVVLLVCRCGCFCCCCCFFFRNGGRVDVGFRADILFSVDFSYRWRPLDVGRDASYRPLEEIDERRIFPSTSIFFFLSLSSAVPSGNRMLVRFANHFLDQQNGYPIIEIEIWLARMRCERRFAYFHWWRTFVVSGLVHFERYAHRAPPIGFHVSAKKNEMFSKIKNSFLLCSLASRFF